MIAQDFHTAARLVAKHFGVALEHFPDDGECTEVYQYDAYGVTGDWAAVGQLAMIQLFAPTRRVNRTFRCDCIVEFGGGPGKDDPSWNVDFGSLTELVEALNDIFPNGKMREDG